VTSHTASALFIQYHFETYLKASNIPCLVWHPCCVRVCVGCCSFCCLLCKL